MVNFSSMLIARYLIIETLFLFFHFLMRGVNFLLLIILLIDNEYYTNLYEVL